ncbi:hypothetical protein D3C76_1605670 [compost metagenome]
MPFWPWGLFMSRCAMMITSASCSISPESRRSDIFGLASGRFSILRLSWARATIGMPSSLASALSPRLMAPSSWLRFWYRLFGSGAIRLK